MLKKKTEKRMLATDSHGRTQTKKRGKRAIGERCDRLWARGEGRGDELPRIKILYVLFQR